jgi:hypothetical protein
VGNITSGTLFYFEPNAERTGLNLANDPLLSDLIADNDDEISAVTFGTGFTGISDIETGLDGNLYILTFDRETEGLVSLYRILPAAEAATTTAGASPSPSDPVTPLVTDEDEVGVEDQGAQGDEANGDSDSNNEEDQDENNN